MTENPIAITISHKIEDEEGKCSQNFTGLTYKRWTIIVDVNPQTDKIKHVKFMLSQSYPHNTVKVKNTGNTFQYSTCGYQSINVGCLIDLGKDK